MKRLSLEGVQYIRIELQYERLNKLDFLIPFGFALCFYYFAKTFIILTAYWSGCLFLDQKEGMQKILSKITGNDNFHKPAMKYLFRKHDLIFIPAWLAIFTLLITAGIL